MQVGFITRSLSREGGGVYTSVRELARSLREYSNLAVRVFGLEDQYFRADLPWWDGVPVCSCPVQGPRGFGYSASMIEAFQTADPDLMHVHGIWMYYSLACQRWADRSRRPYLISPHGMLDPWAVSHSAWKKKIAALLYEDRHLRAAACLHALNPEEAQSLRQYGLKNPICVIPNGVRPPPVDELVDPPFWANSVPQGRKVLLYLGRLHLKKNLLNLLDGWALARARKPGLAQDWHLVVAGWGHHTYEKQLKTRCGEKGLGESVHFPGPVFAQDKIASFRRAQAFILPSLSEGQPMSILEAWANQLPVLLTKHCNLPGQQHGSAIMIDTSVEGIAAGLDELFQSSGLRLQEMGRKGRQLVEQSYCWPSIAKEMKAIYEWVAGRGGRPACVLN